MLKVALIVNPMAGIGGSVGLKGSDGAETVTRARELGGEPRAAECARLFVASLGDAAAAFEWFSPSAAMGEDYLDGFAPHIVHRNESDSSAADTVAAARAAIDRGIDLILFVGGDGTARDILTAAPGRTPVLGIPAGVKMHSGVFAVTPYLAAELVAALASGELVNLQDREVRDYDAEAADTAHRIRTYGELRVPEAGHFLQHTKVGGRESEPLAVEEIAAEFGDRDAGIDILVGPGTTCLQVKRVLGLDPERATLRGFDLRVDAAWETDVAADRIAQAPNLHVVLSFSRHQGFLLGRGNQQLTPTILRTMRWPDAFSIVGTRSKLMTLEGRPLRVDTGSRELDEALAGLIEIRTGYEDRVLYRVA